jgi:hypothetical protein
MGFVMHRQRVVAIVCATVLGSVVLAQPGRGGSQWLTAQADAQRTSWIRSDDKISVDALAKPGFALQWTRKLDNQPRGALGLTQGVTASGVTLFVPMSVVAGSSNTVYGVDNDLGYVVWKRQFDAASPNPTPACPGGIAAGATRIVSVTPATPTPNPFGGGGGRGVVGYRSLLGEPGAGVPVEGRAGGPGRAAAPAPPAAGRGAPPPGVEQGAARGAAPAAPPIPAARGGQTADRIPGAPRMEEGGRGNFGFLFRPSGVAYVVSGDGMLHVVGLPSGKDLQKPAAFLPANAKWSSPIAVDTTMYAATSGNCGGAPDGVWAIDLDSDAKPVTSWKTNGGGVVGAVAFTSDGTLIAAIGPGPAAGDGKANAIVALEPKTLRLKDWFTQPGAEFVTGPTILRRGDKELVAAATKDGRVLLLDAAALGGGDHGSPLAASKPVFGAGAAIGAPALATWQGADSWILVPVSGKLAADAGATNGAIAAGVVVALKLTDAAGGPALAPGWVSHDLTAPATPVIVNGVVFALATGAAAAGRGGAAVLRAYDGGTGKELWNSGKAMPTAASPGSMWSGLGQIYVGARDGSLYAFGFNDERR